MLDNKEWGREKVTRLRECPKEGEGERREKREETRYSSTKLDQPNQERRAENAGEQRVYLQTAHFARVLGF